MSEVRVNNLSNESLSGGPTISGITTFSSPYFFVPPQGDTASRPSSCPPGSLRFNTDSAKLEYYRGDTIGWQEIEAELTSPLGGGTGSNTGLGVRGIFAGGQNVPGSDKFNTIDFITISTLGNAQDFGDLTDTVNTAATTASRTRGIIAGGFPTRGDIDFITIASTGNATDSGSDLTVNRNNHSACSDGVRAVFSGGYTGALINTIDYITIAAIGTAQDFGDLNNGTSSCASCESSTRGIIAGGASPNLSSPNNSNVIDFITIASTGNATDFGDLTQRRGSLDCGFGNSTRGIFAGGYAPGDQNTIDFITIATTGNATDFGDTTFAVSQAGGCASPTRGVIGGGIGGAPSRSHKNIIQFVNILSTGDAADFGDLSQSRNALRGTSNGHGGL